MFCNVMTCDPKLYRVSLNQSRASTSVFNGNGTITYPQAIYSASVEMSVREVVEFYLMIGKSRTELGLPLPNGKEVVDVCVLEVEVNS